MFVIIAHVRAVVFCIYTVCVVCSAVWKMDRPCEELEAHRAGRSNIVHHI